MQTTIKPIHEHDAPKAIREFFTEEFRTQQLGQAGHWLLLGNQQPALANPVQVNQVEQLIAVSRSPDAVDQPVAWRCHFEVGRSVSTLWALSPEPTSRSIELAHRQAVELTLRDWLVGPLATRHDGQPEKPSAAFALFPSGTGEGQIPDLHTTVLLFNSTFLPQAEHARFSAEQVISSEAHLNRSSGSYHFRVMTGTLGLLDRNPQTNVPRGLFSHLIEAADKTSSEYAMYGGPFTGQAILHEWRRTATENGFGPRQVAELLSHAQAAGKRLEAAYRQLNGTSTVGDRLGRWFRQGRESFHSLISSQKHSHQQTASTPKAPSPQPSKANDISHSH